MIRKLFALFIVLFATTSSILNNGHSSKECSANNFSYSARKKSTLQSNDVPYDIETYDIYGNHQFYCYDDFEINDDGKDLPSYQPSVQNRDYGQYAMYYSLPYSAVCTFYSTYDTNNDGIGDTTYVGSGFLVGPDKVLTAEENTYHPTYGYATDMYVAPGEHIEGSTRVRPFGIHHWISISRGSYHSTQNVNDNWALVKLNSQVGNTAGYLGVSYTGISNGSTVKTIGYNSYSSSQATIYQGIVSSLSTYKFNYSANPPMMANGGPVMDSFLGTVFGIHSSQRTTINNIQYCQACKISIYIKSWIQQDCGPLNVTIFADPDSGSSSGSGVGHAWVVVKNNSTEYVQIGKMSLAPNTAVSLGTWGINAHDGIYYNYEHYLTTSPNSDFLHRVSYSRNIFASDWNNTFVLDNDNWSLYYNCSYFAATLWNSMFPLYTFGLGAWPMPSTIANQIEQISGFESCAFVDGTNSIGYYSGNTFIYSLS